MSWVTIIFSMTASACLGLGLSLSRSIALAHGGRLWGENQARGGAAFHFTVPVWQGDSLKVAKETREYS
jgi:two-component system, LuxR family, sensor kinase FixL